MLFANIDEIIDGTPEEKPMTNADRIRAMSDEELADRLINYDSESDRYETDAGCFYVWDEAFMAEVAWLQQPAEEVNHE